MTKVREIMYTYCFAGGRNTYNTIILSDFHFQLCLSFSCWQTAVSVRTHMHIHI